MTKKIYIKPPPPMRAAVLAQIILGAILLPVGPLFVFIAEGEARPFVAIFALVWMAGCIGIIVMGVSARRFLQQGRIPICEIEDDEEGKA